MEGEIFSRLVLLAAAEFASPSTADAVAGCSCEQHQEGGLPSLLIIRPRHSSSTEETNNNEEESPHDNFLPAAFWSLSRAARLLNGRKSLADQCVVHGGDVTFRKTSRRPWMVDDVTILLV